MALTCKDILDISLSHFKITDSDSFGIIEMLLKSTPQITRIVIRKLQRDCQEISNFVPKSTILCVINCLNSDHIGPASINLLIEFLRDDLLDDDDIMHQLSSPLDTSKTEAMCRVYEVCVGIGIKNFTRFEKVQFIIERCLNDFTSRSNDVLLQLNLLEIIQKLCSKDYGFSFLESKNVLQSLARKIEGINEDPLSALLLPGLMKFFGSIAAVYPQKIFQSYSFLFDLLFNCILEHNTSLIYSALSTLGYLSKSEECKKIIDRQVSFGNKFIQVLAHIYHSISNYPNDVKLRALDCLHNAFALDDEDEMINNQIASICEKWYIVIFGTDLSTLLNICKTPFDDLSTAAFDLLRSLSFYAFGQEGIARTAGFLEFLLDRKAGTSIELKQKKYEVIEILARSSLFDATVIAQFSKYLRNGINYVEPMTEVSFESS